MSYKLVCRVYPEKAKPITFHFKNDKDFGMLNFCDWKNDINKIHNCDQKVIKYKDINIYFPLPDVFYVKKYYSKNGFTFRKLVALIANCGIESYQYDIITNPSHYRNIGGIKAEYLLGRFAITWSPDFSDITIKENNVYVSVQS